MPAQTLERFRGDTLWDPLSPSEGSAGGRYSTGRRPEAGSCWKGWLPGLVSTSDFLLNSPAPVWPRTRTKADPVVRYRVLVSHVPPSMCTERSGVESVRDQVEATTARGTDAESVALRARGHYRLWFSEGPKQDHRSGDENGRFVLWRGTRYLRFVHRQPAAGAVPHRRNAPAALRHRVVVATS